MAATEEHISLNVLVDERKNKIVYVQAGKDFVDVLLSFLTLPLGTIARLVGKESNINKVRIGSLSSLYNSVSNVEKNRFWTDTCKDMLLQPKSSMGRYCQKLKLNIDDSEKTQYFICENWDCSRKFSGRLLSTFKNQRCICGELMNRVTHFESLASIASEGFVADTAAFIISDDLKVIADDFQFSCLPVKHGYEDTDAIKLVTVNVTQKEIVDLLKCSFLSTTPLTDALLVNKKQLSENLQLNNNCVTGFDFDNSDADANGGQIMKVKAIIRKSNKSVLFVLAEEDFVDFIFSFLTFPLGGVENMLNGNSGLGCIDNLYKSMFDLDCDKYLRSPDLKDKLVKTPIAHPFKLRNKILPIDEMPYSYSCSRKNDAHGRVITVIQEGYISDVASVLSFVEPQSSNCEAYSKNGGRGFVKKPSLYMVTDDLVVTPSSSVSAISFVTKLGVPPSDLEERVINIGQKEGLRLLKACLISSSTLTIGLSVAVGQFLKIPEVKNISNNEEFGFD